MHYLITGGTGFIGTALTGALQADGHEITVLSRRAQPDKPGCHCVADLDEIASTTQIDAIINLAGASLAGSRWTNAYKREILHSRLDTTRRVVAFCRRTQRRPQALLSASAVGYYGHHGDESLAEDGAATAGFSQSLCHQWEQAALAAGEMGLRVCLLRLGVVLDRSGGALAAMARPFRFGVANWIGSGNQWLSWVHRRDAIAAIRFLLERQDLSGPFNVTAPEPVTSRGFCNAMKRHQRTFITAPVPTAFIRLLVGEMADELLLQGQRVLPAALGAAGFEFTFPGLDSALADILSPA